MQFLKKTTAIDFMGPRRLAVGISIVLIIASLASLAVRKLNFGVDFTGGVLVQAIFSEAADDDVIRTALEQAGFTGATVQYFGSSKDVLVRLPPEDSKLSAPSDNPNAGKDTLGNAVMRVLETVDSGVQKGRVEFVGPQVGEELRERGGLAMLIALLLILAYVAFRFQWKFAVGAVAALIHDVILVIGFFSIFQFDFDLSVLAAVLAVIGYSLNDTIVVFDRIRENFHEIRKSMPESIVNTSINQMLARTIITGVTTLLVLVALYIFGGSAVKPFSIALIIGIIVGTYSSIYVASATALGLDVTVEDLLPPVDDRTEADALP